MLSHLRDLGTRKVFSARYLSVLSEFHAGVDQLLHGMVDTFVRNLFVLDTARVGTSAHFRLSQSQNSVEALVCPVVPFDVLVEGSLCSIRVKKRRRDARTGHFFCRVGLPLDQTNSRCLCVLRRTPPRAFCAISENPALLVVEGLDSLNGIGEVLLEEYSILAVLRKGHVTSNPESEASGLQPVVDCWLGTAELQTTTVQQSISKQGFNDQK